MEIDHDWVSIIGKIVVEDVSVNFIKRWRLRPSPAPNLHKSDILWSNSPSSTIIDIRGTQSLVMEVVISKFKLSFWQNKRFPSSAVKPSAVFPGSDLAGALFRATCGELLASPALKDGILACSLRPYFCKYYNRPQASAVASQNNLKEWSPVAELTSLFLPAT